jgi:proton-coupled amino acid transporter
LRVSDCTFSALFQYLFASSILSLLRIIPITEAMKEPHKFPKVLTGVMIGVATLFAGFGVMGYAAYGSNIQTVVIVNLPQEQKFVQVVQFLYTVAIVLR